LWLLRAISPQSPEINTEKTKVTTALAVATPRLTPDALQMIMHVAPTIHGARLFGTANPEQAAAIMIKGFELGFSLTASFENIHVIEGKPSLSPKGALALIYNSPLCAGVTIVDESDKGVPSGCTVTMARKGGLTYTARYTMADAERAGVVKDGSGWKKYPANMLRWRAIGYAADIVFPDVIGGTKRADEFGADLTPDGDVIEGSWTMANQGVSVAGNTKVEAVSQSQPVPADSNRLDGMVKKYGADKIMGANGGKIPGTNAELDAIEEELANREMEITGGK
jgi:hypothetical protein